MTYFSAPGIPDRSGYLLNALGMKPIKDTRFPGRVDGVTNFEILKRSAVGHFLYLNGDSYPTIARKLGYKYHVTPMKNIKSLRALLSVNDPLAEEAVQIVKSQLIKLGIIK